MGRDILMKVFRFCLVMGIWQFKKTQKSHTGVEWHQNLLNLRKFTDRRLRWVYIFTDEDYNRAKAMYDERMANYGSGEK